MQIDQQSSDVFEINIYDNQDEQTLIGEVETLK